MRSACIHLFGIILIAFALSCNGWGKDGHQIVAQVASHYLTNTTTYQTSKILGNYSLADVSTWPDAYVQTPEGKWSLHLHYVNLNQSNLVFVYEACQPPLADPPGCVITAIDNFTAILATDYQKASYQPCSDPNSEPCPLSFLTHFLGDSHEPLHICYGIDEGGNLYNVVYDGICTELHDVWDTRLIQTYEANNNVNWNDMANQITNWLDDNPKIISDFSFTTKSKEWGDESFIVCRFVPYNMSPGTVPAASNWIHTIYNYITPQTKNNKKKAMSSDSCGTVLPVNYYEKNIPVVFEQLAKAGIRLAYRLNSIYDPSFNGFGERN